MILTRLKCPVSTSFLLLGVFAETSDDFYAILEKSFYGFGLALGIALGF